MEILKDILIKLKNKGCVGIKISFEDEGALLNEVISMRYLTASIGLELTIKIGGCEAKRDIIDCINIGCDNIVAPMIESKFSLNKFISSSYEYNKKRGFNIETITGYNNIHDIVELLDKIDFIVVGRVDFVNSIDKSRDYVDSNDMLDIVTNIFKISKKANKKCCLGGSISIKSKDFIKQLLDNNLIDNFETRYVIYDLNKINMNDYGQLINLANEFELEWLKYINQRYNNLSSKDARRIKMIEDRIKENNINSI
jgi:hypothetical protein